MVCVGYYPQNKPNPVQYARPYIPGRTPPAAYRTAQQAPYNPPAAQPQTMPVAQGQPLPVQQQPAMFVHQQQPTFAQQQQLIYPQQTPAPNYGTIPSQKLVSRLCVCVCVCVHVCMWFPILDSKILGEDIGLTFANTLRKNFLALKTEQGLGSDWYMFLVVQWVPLNIIPHNRIIRLLS